MKRVAYIVLVALLLFGSSGCTGRRDDAVILTGRLVDAETGKPVVREGISILVYPAGSSSPCTSEPDADRSDFEIELDTPAGAAETTVRLRVFDSTRAYEVFERELTFKGVALDVDVKLVPTHWVRLHGRILWRDGTRLRPLSEGGPNVEHALLYLGPHMLFAEGEETYSLRVPREILRLAAVNTSHGLVPAEIDLRGTTEAERELDLVLEK